jgi:hypothetical protein
MCLMCEQEDLYFLYLERLEQEKRLARGVVSPPDANWLWPALAAAPADAPAPAAPRRETKPGFICDTPGE